jgi:uncharacterized protein (DUF169 family)
MAMEWQQWCAELKDVLGLTKTPVAVTWTDHPPGEAEPPKCRVCSAIHRAAAGEIIRMDAESSACPGGTVFFGFRPPDPTGAERLREFLVNGEKLFSCPAAIFRSQRTGPPPPTGMARYAVFAPLDRMPLRPDVTILFVNAWQASRLVGLAWYETGEAMHCDPSGASCRSVVAYPLVTNRLNVSFGDITERRSEKLPEGELYVSLPWTQLRSIVASLSGSGAGRAEIDLTNLPH